MKTLDSSTPTGPPFSWRRTILVLIVLELLVIGVLLVLRLRSPIPPIPNLGRLPKSTADDLQRLQDRARSNQFAAWKELGEAYLAFGYFAEAEACLRHASQQQPRDFAAAYGWAYSLDRMGRLDDANSKFEAAARLADRQMAVACRYHIGRNQMRAEQAFAAVDVFTSLQGFPAADHQRARLLVAQGRLWEAVPLIQQLEALSKNEVEVQSLAIQADRSRGRSQSVAHRTRLLERCAHSLQLTDHLEYLQPIRSKYGLMGTAAQIENMVTSGRQQAAVREFERLLHEADPETMLLVLMKGVELQLQTDRADAALETLNLTSRLQSLSPFGRHLKGDALSLLGQHDKARLTWEGANRLRPRARSHQQLVAYWKSRGDEDQSRREEALAQRAIGIEAFRRNDLNTARTALESATRLNPQDARTWYYLGEAQLASGETEAGQRSLQECLRLSPDDGRARAALKLMVASEQESQEENN